MRWKIMSGELARTWWNIRSSSPLRRGYSWPWLDKWLLLDSPILCEKDELTGSLVSPTYLQCCKRNRALQYLQIRCFELWSLDFAWRWSSSRKIEGDFCNCMSYIMSSRQQQMLHRLRLHAAWVTYSFGIDLEWQWMTLWAPTGSKSHLICLDAQSCRCFARDWCRRSRSITGGGLRSTWPAWLSLANAGSWNEGSLDPKFSPKGFKETRTTWSHLSRCILYGYLRFWPKCDILPCWRVSHVMFRLFLFQPNHMVGVIEITMIWPTGSANLTNWWMSKKSKFQNLLLT